jgi:hypothetical protein
LIGALKHLPFNQRAERADRIAEIARADLPDDLMMRAEEVHRLHTDRLTIGAHTVNHTILSMIPEDEARSEIALAASGSRTSSVLRSGSSPIRTGSRPRTTTCCTSGSCASSASTAQ